MKNIHGNSKLELTYWKFLGLQRLTPWVYSGQGWGLIGPSKIGSSRNRLPPPSSRRIKRQTLRRLSRLYLPQVAILADGDISRLLSPSYSGSKCWYSIPRRYLPQYALARMNCLNDTYAQLLRVGALCNREDSTLQYRPTCVTAAAIWKQSFASTTLRLGPSLDRQIALPLLVACATDIIQRTTRPVIRGEGSKSHLHLEFRKVSVQHAGKIEINIYRELLTTSDDTEVLDKGDLFCQCLHPTATSRRFSDHFTKVADNTPSSLAH